METKIGDYLMTPLKYAAVNGREDVVSLLVQQYGAHLDNKGGLGGCTPLGWAIGSNHLATVQCLVELGAGRDEKVVVYSAASYIVNPA